MTRPLRIEQTDNWYYIRNESRKGTDVFKRTSDVTFFLDLLVETSSRYGVSCHAYTLLANELHLLLHISKPNLSRFMRQLSGVYTQRYNKKYQQNGSLFKGRYQSTLIDPEYYPVWISAHIHQLFIINKSKKLTQSSYQDYLIPDNDNNIVKTSKIKGNFAKGNPLTGYRQFIEEKLPNAIEQAVTQKQLPPIIGSHEFKNKYQHLLELSSPECCAIKRMKPLLNESDIIKYTARFFKVPKSRILHAQYGIHNNSDARNMAMFLCQQHTDMTLKEIAIYFKLGHYASVSNRISHFKKVLKQQSSLQKNVDEINKSLQQKIISN